jgi:hypothetical protein
MDKRYRTPAKPNYKFGFLLCVAYSCQWLEIAITPRRDSYLTPRNDVVGGLCVSVGGGQNCGSSFILS